MNDYLIYLCLPPYLAQWYAHECNQVHNRDKATCPREIYRFPTPAEQAPASTVWRSSSNHGTLFAGCLVGTQIKDSASPQRNPVAPSQASKLGRFFMRLFAYAHKSISLQQNFKIWILVLHQWLIYHNFQIQFGRNGRRRKIAQGCARHRRYKRHGMPGQWTKLFGNGGAEHRTKREKKRGKLAIYVKKV